MSSSRDRYLAFRQSFGPLPRLAHRSVRARGLDFAVYSSPPVADATPLCCINGGLIFDHRLLWPALAPLARHRQIVLYDQRGRGRSQPPPGVRAARIEHDAGDVRALREALGLDRWDVLGHSWGGGIAMLATAEDAAAVRRLVLVDPVGLSSDWLPGLHAAALALLRESDVAAYQQLAAFDPASLTAADPAVHSDYARAFYPAWFADQSLPRTFSPPRSVSLTGAVVAARLRRDGYDWRQFARAVSPPSLVLHGEQDVLSPEHSRRTVALLPHARLEIVPRAGHMPFLEAPDRFFSLVDEFLRSPADTPQRTPSPPG